MNDLDSFTFYLRLIDNRWKTLVLTINILSLLILQKKILYLYFKALTRKIFNNTKSNNNNKKAKGKSCNFGQTVLFKIINHYTKSVISLYWYKMELQNIYWKSFLQFCLVIQIINVVEKYFQLNIIIWRVASECTQDTQINYFVLILSYFIFGD